jgi:hypothetical protein
MRHPRFCPAGSGALAAKRPRNPHGLDAVKSAVTNLAITAAQTRNSLAACRTRRPVPEVGFGTSEICFGIKGVWLCSNFEFNLDAYLPVALR